MISKRKKKMINGSKPYSKYDLARDVADRIGISLAEALRLVEKLGAEQAEEDKLDAAQARAKLRADLSRPGELEDFIRDLEACGISKEVADDLIDDLFDIFEPATQTKV
jgi:hypothetical protein